MGMKTLRHTEESPLLRVPVVMMNEGSGGVLDDEKADIKQRRGNNSTHESSKGVATSTQTVLTLSKTCMGTGVLGLPFACQQGGILVYCFGLMAIALWNAFSVQRLVQCLDYLPHPSTQKGISTDTENGMEFLESEEEASLPSSASENDSSNETRINPSRKNNPTPPLGTSVLGQVAWYALGPWGLQVMDALVILLLIGIITAYVAAVVTFLGDTKMVTTGTKLGDALLASVVIGGLAVVPDISHLSKTSAVGLAILALTLVVIAGYGCLSENVELDYFDDEQGMDGDQILTIIDVTSQKSSDPAFRIEDSVTAMALNLWPLGVTGVSHFFGITVFGFGVVPLTYQYHSSLRDPSAMVPCTVLALGLVALAYAVVGLGLYILYPSITGEVLHEIPSSGWLPVFTRLCMVVVILMTAPLLVVPCGELLEGKFQIHLHWQQRACRMGIVLVSALVAIGVPSLVQALSLVGCTSVGLVSFVMPPLLHLQLVTKHAAAGSRGGGTMVTRGVDVCFLLWGVTATVISTVYTLKSMQSD